MYSHYFLCNGGLKKVLSRNRILLLKGEANGMLEEGTTAVYNSSHEVSDDMCGIDVVNEVKFNTTRPYVVCIDDTENAIADLSPLLYCEAPVVIYGQATDELPEEFINHCEVLEKLIFNS